MKPLYTKEFKELYTVFDHLVRSKDYKTGGGKMYQANLKEFFQWMEQLGITTISTITTLKVKEYLEHLIVRPNKRKEGTLSVSTINHHLFSLRLFFEHLLIIGYTTEVPVVPNNLPRNNMERASLTQEEMQLLYANVQTPLEKAILSTAYGCGLRRAEMVQLNLTDLVFQKGVLVVTNGKGNKLRDVMMSEAVINDLQEYAHTERLGRVRSIRTTTRAYFLNSKGERLSGDHMNKTLKALVQRTGSLDLQEKKVTLHSLRHSIATHLVDRGMGMLAIRKFLGHSETDTTSLYMARRKQKNKFII